MQKYFNSVTNSRGDAILGARVAVTKENGLPATIYSDNGVTVQANPMTTDGNGFFAFYAAAGRYTIRVSGVGIPPIVITDILLEDELADFPSRDELAAPTGASEVGYGIRTALDAIGEIKYLEDFTGCDPTGVTSSDAAVTLALAWANGTNRQIVGRNKYFFNVGGHLIDCHWDFSVADIVTSGTLEAPVFLLGCTRKSIDFGTNKANGSWHLNAQGWPYASTFLAASPTAAVADNKITFKTIANYRHGIALKPVTGGRVPYNTVKGQVIEDCKYNLDIYPVDDGWVNQNDFDIHVLRNNSTSINGYGLRCAKDTVGASPNGNVFRHTCMEGAGPNAMFWKNSNGLFIAPRFELRPTGSIQFEGDANFSSGTTFLFPDQFSEDMIVYSGAVLRPTIVAHNTVNFPGSFESGRAELGGSQLLAHWRHIPTNGGKIGVDALRIIPGRLQLMTRPATNLPGDSSIAIEMDSVTGGIPRISFPLSTTTIQYKATVAQGPIITGLFDLGSANVSVVTNPAALTAGTFAGQMRYVTSLQKPVWWSTTSSSWKDSDGVAV